MIGIYKITNNITNKSYIGQSIHIAARWAQHKNSNEWKRKNNLIYQDFEKYGIENFSFEIIEECIPEKLDEKEIFWINYYNTYNNGYNLTPGGDSKLFNHQKFYDLWDNGKSVYEIHEILNCSLTTVREYLAGYKNYSVDESRKRGCLYGHNKSCSDNNKWYEIIYQYDKNYNLINTWKSTKEIQRELNIDASSIGKVIRGIRKTAGGFIWSDKIINK